MKNIQVSELWFAVGSQHLYGPEALAQVARNAEAVSGDEAVADGDEVVFLPPVGGG